MRKGRSFADHALIGSQRTDLRDPAIDRQRHAGHESALGSRKEQCGLRDIPCVALDSERRDRAADTAALALQMCGDHRRHDMARRNAIRSEEHTSELQSLLRISYAVFCAKKKNKMHKHMSVAPQLTSKI